MQKQKAACPFLNPPSKAPAILTDWSLFSITSQQTTEEGGEKSLSLIYLVLL